MPKALITSVPFAERDRLPLTLLESAGIDYVVNPLGRRLREDELAHLIADVDLLIAGTEPITRRVMEHAAKLKHISRIGIGLDNVDLQAAAARGVRVSYTPEAPAPAVVELTIGLILSVLRSIHVANGRMHRGEWTRFFGRRVSEVTIGVIGVGRIGRGVLAGLAGLGARRLLANDVVPNFGFLPAHGIEWVTKEEIYRSADVISLHVPLTAETRHLLRREQLLMMKPDALLINTARGGIIHEPDLAAVLDEGRLGGAAIDVFEQEPYTGPLQAIERCLLTSHMGSMSVDCRTRMEIEATEEAIRFITGQPLRGPVPEAEYAMQYGRS